MLILPCGFPPLNAQNHTVQVVNIRELHSETWCLLCQFELNSCLGRKCSKEAARGLLLRKGHFAPAKEMHGHVVGDLSVSSASQCKQGFTGMQFISLSCGRKRRCLGLIGVACWVAKPWED